jgi:hypothetical protein
MVQCRSTAVARSQFVCHSTLRFPYLDFISSVVGVTVGVNCLLVFNHMPCRLCTTFACGCHTEYRECLTSACTSWRFWFHSYDFGTSCVLFCLSLLRFFNGAFSWPPRSPFRTFLFLVACQFRVWSKCTAALQTAYPSYLCAFQWAFFLRKILPVLFFFRDTRNINPFCVANPL